MIFGGSPISWGALYLFYITIKHVQSLFLGIISPIFWGSAGACKGPSAASRAFSSWLARREAFEPSLGPVAAIGSTQI